MDYPARLDILVFTDVMEELSFPVGYNNENGVFVPVDLTGRTLRFVARTPDANSADILVDSAADASVCEPLSGDGTFIRLMIPSALAATLDIGDHEHSIVDITDAGTDGEVLIALGKFSVQRQAVR